MDPKTLRVRLATCLFFVSRVQSRDMMLQGLGVQGV